MKHTIKRALSVLYLLPLGVMYFGVQSISSLIQYIVTGEITVSSVFNRWLDSKIQQLLMSTAKEGLTDKLRL